MSCGDDTLFLAAIAAGASVTTLMLVAVLLFMVGERPARRRKDQTSANASGPPFRHGA